MKRLSCDIAVIGAGPAGTTFATRMVQLGYDVCLIERALFPRAHLGESLTPGVMPMLASIGMAAAIERIGFPRVNRVHTNWDGIATERVDPRAEGMLVDRGVFDAALVSHAQSIGVRVFQPAQLLKHERAAHGWQLQLEVADEPMELTARFIADGTGRSGRLGSERRSVGARTMALYGYWTGSSLPDQPRISATGDGWQWGVPIPDGSYNTIVFVDAERVRADREGGGGTERLLRQLLATTPLDGDIRGAQLRSAVRATDATPYVNDDVIGADYIAIGDAALAIDPLSSSGVQKAIQSALSGAIVANTILARAELTELSENFYRDSISRSSTRHHLWAGEHYMSPAGRFDSPFWRSRAGVAHWVLEQPAGDDVPLQFSSQATLESRACLGSQYVEVRRTLMHPRLEGPVAFLSGQDVASLMQHVQRGMTPAQLAVAWSPTVPPRTGLSIARWLSIHGVLEPVEGAIIEA